MQKEDCALTENIRWRTALFCFDFQLLRVSKVFLLGHTCHKPCRKRVYQTGSCNPLYRWSFGSFFLYTNQLISKLSVSRYAIKLFFIALFSLSVLYLIAFETKYTVATKMIIKMAIDIKDCFTWCSPPSQINSDFNSNFKGNQFIFHSIISNSFITCKLGFNAFCSLHMH